MHDNVLTSPLAAPLESPLAAPPEASLATTPWPEPFAPPAFTPPEHELPLLALLRAFGTDALRTWPRRAYEERVLVRPFIGRRNVLLNDPAAIRALLVEGEGRFARSSATLRLLRPLIGGGLFLAEGAEWRHQRRTLAPAFTPRAIAGLWPAMRGAIGDSLDRLQVAAPQREAGVDLLALCQHLALEVAGRTMFSLGMRRYGGSLREIVFAYGRRGAPGMLDLVLPERFTTPRDLIRRADGRRWMALVERMIAARRREAAPAPDLLAMIEAARDPETGAGFDATAIRDQVATMILAGHETTALTIFWALTMLAQATPWQERIAAEAAASGDASDPAALPLTRAVVEETLRLYPPAFAIVRVARGAETVGGVALRAGDAAIVAPWVLHRHRALWSQPELFDPRRFLPGAALPDRFAYLPFGAGARACIGASFARDEAVLAVAGLVGRFRLALAGSRPVLPVAVVTTTPDHAPLFQVRARR